MRDGVCEAQAWTPWLSLPFLPYSLQGSPRCPSLLGKPEGHSTVHFHPAVNSFPGSRAACNPVQLLRCEYGNNSGKNRKLKDTSGLVRCWQLWDALTPHSTVFTKDLLCAGATFPPPPVGEVLEQIKLAAPRQQSPSNVPGEAWFQPSLQADQGTWFTNS